MKKTIILFATVLGLSSSLYASSVMPAKSEARKLTVEEKNLQNRLESELSVSLEEILQSTETALTKIVVYNSKGELVQVQSSNIDKDHLPEGAHLLMIEGTSAYYMTF